MISSSENNQPYFGKVPRRVSWSRTQQDVAPFAEKSIDSLIRSNSSELEKKKTGLWGSLTSRPKNKLRRKSSLSDSHSHQNMGEMELNTQAITNAEPEPYRHPNHIKLDALNSRLEEPEQSKRFSSKREKANEKTQSVFDPNSTDLDNPYLEFPIPQKRRTFSDLNDLAKRSSSFLSDKFPMRRKSWQAGDTAPNLAESEFTLGPNIRANSFGDILRSIRKSSTLSNFKRTNTSTESTTASESTILKSTRRFSWPLTRSSKKLGVNSDSINSSNSNVPESKTGFYSLPEISNNGSIDDINPHRTIVLSCTNPDDEFKAENNKLHRAQSLHSTKSDDTEPMVQDSVQESGKTTARLSASNLLKVISKPYVLNHDPENIFGELPGKVINPTQKHIVRSFGEWSIQAREPRSLITDIRTNIDYSSKNIKTKVFAKPALKPRQSDEEFRNTTQEWIKKQGMRTKTRAQIVRELDRGFRNARMTEKARAFVKEEQAKQAAKAKTRSELENSLSVGRMAEKARAFAKEERSKQEAKNVVMVKKPLHTVVKAPLNSQKLFVTPQHISEFFKLSQPEQQKFMSFILSKHLLFEMDASLAQDFLKKASHQATVFGPQRLAIEAAPVSDFASEPHSEAKFVKTQRGSNKKSSAKKPVSKMSSQLTHARALKIKNELLAKGETEESIKANIDATRKRARKVLKKQRAETAASSSGNVSVQNKFKAQSPKVNTHSHKTDEQKKFDRSIKHDRAASIPEPESYEAFLLREQQRVKSTAMSSALDDTASVSSAGAPSLTFSTTSADSGNSYLSSASSVLNNAANSVSGLFGHLKGGIDSYKTPQKLTKAFNPFESTAYSPITTF